jgi:arachidonate 15-lipoxygenase
MIPCLPSQEPRPASRRAALARDRARYLFQHAYPCEELPQGIALADHVPEGEGFGLRFLEAIGPLDLRVAANALMVQLLETGETLSSHVQAHTLLGLLGLERTQPSGAPFPRTRKALEGITASFPADLSAWDRLFPLLPMPMVAGVLASSPYLQDRLFGWQRLAGANPLMLTAVRGIAPRSAVRDTVTDAVRHVLDWITHHREQAQAAAEAPAGQLPATFHVTDAHVQQTLPGETLGGLIQQGRLFLCDYRMTLGLPLGTWSSGLLGIPRTKHLYSPFALFAWVPATDEAPGWLQPLAIQCDVQAPHDQVFTPKDGIAWKMAKTIVQQADATTQELVSHLARTHLILEAVILSVRREMAPWHPVRVLLDAHGFNTLAINDFAAHHLIAPGGQVDQLFAATLEGNLKLTARGLATFHFGQLSPEAQLASRGLCETGVCLEAYPWRDDARLLWPIVHRFVARYLPLYYASDADVAGDTELGAMLRTLGAKDGGALQGVPVVQDRAALTDMLARVLWTATLQHACLNNAQYDHLGYAPAAPGALYREAPKPGEPLAQTDWMSMLPPISQALSQAALLYQLANTRMDPLGHFPPGTFADPRVDQVVADYQGELAWADGVLAGRDRTRFLPYPWLRPSQAGNSVFI